MNHAPPFFLPKSITTRRLDKVMAVVNDRYDTLEYVLLRSSLLLPLTSKTLFPCTGNFSTLSYNCSVRNGETRSRATFNEDWGDALRVQGSLITSLPEI